MSLQSALALANHLTTTLPAEGHSFDQYMLAERFGVIANIRVGGAR